jgi:chromodomain-helicase-DNA-binding protein 4
MNFLDPEEWHDLEKLEEEHEELTEDLVRQLHNRLRPYFLRRTKSEVLQLPPKVCYHFILPTCKVMATSYFNGLQ